MASPFHRLPALATLLAVLSVVLACAPAPSASPTAPASAPPTTVTQSGPHGTLRIAWGPEPTSLAPKMAAPGSTAFNELALTFNSALTYHDGSGMAVPLLARELPSLENGDWVVNPDGTMVTTWRLRENARWHDGEPITAQDYRFAYEVAIDPDVPVYRRDPETSMAGVEAPDDYTLVIRWKQPFYAANALFYRQLDPLPRHILEPRYLADKANFAVGSVWTTDYVGSGPFRLVRWDPGSSLTAQAFNDWVLGPPKTANLEIRFVLDQSAIIASLLSGEIDITGHPWVGPAGAATIRDRWVGGGLGYITNVESRLEHMDFQYRDVPNWQPAVTDVRVRQALISAIDRQALNDLVNAGIGGSVANTFMLPTDALFPDVDRVIAKYPFDPSRAAQLLAAAGWSRPHPDAQVLNASGQPLHLELWTSASGTDSSEATAIVANWRDAGVDAVEFGVPAARASDAEFQTTFPGGALTNRPILPEGFIWISSNAPTPQNRYLGSNRGAFSDDQVDELQARVLSSLGAQAFHDATLALHQRFTEVVGTVPLFYPPDVMLVRNGISGPLGHYTYPAHSWNIFQWEITG